MRALNLTSGRLALTLCISATACGDDGGVDDASSSSTGDAASTSTSSASATSAAASTSTSAGSTSGGSGETSDSSGSSTSDEPSGSTTDDSGSTTESPATLCAEDLGLYADETCDTLADGIVAFEPQYKLWSDGVVKQRFIALPDGDVVDSSDADHWAFPVGTTIWKHFELEDGTRLETRRITKTAAPNEPDSWTFETWVWNEAGDDVASVVNGESDVLGSAHDIPAVSQCTECHSGGQNGMMGGGAAEFFDPVLGFAALQLNHDNSDTTLESLIGDGLLSDNIALADATFPGNAVAQEALGTLHANCGHCHGGAEPAKNMRLFMEVGITSVETSPAYLDTVNQPADTMAPFDIPETRILPGDPTNSAIPWRMSQRDGDGRSDPQNAQMPPLATEVVDTDGLDAVETWISALAD